ncbi:pyruvate formate-lyase-activating protein [Dermabacteraceae bacterium P13115]|nr:pyruvate formate lyase-activating protein [Dermabacteraceae bacterium TAE3-ERU27]MBV7432860.1 pyruvate formate lyase-activating protein [Dermabacteraceae bacterium TAE3-ERU5]
MSAPTAAPSHDGIAGVYKPQPVDVPTPRVRGAAAGIGGAAEDLTPLERAERFRQIREGTLGSIHSWELVTAVDGPGTRMTMFMSGCPLRCVYCHNPDTFQMKDGTMQSLSDIVDRIRRYRKIFRATKGGVTISGGEPLFQTPFVRNVLRACKEMGVHTCVDTSGFLGARADDAMLDDVDLFLLDVKSGIPEIYKKVTERDLEPTIAFGDRLAARGNKIWIRFVLVPGWTDSVENVEAVADIVARWKNVVERVEVLPFHNMGQDKWENLGLDYKLVGLTPPDTDTVKRVREQFRSRGLTVF